MQSSRLMNAVAGSDSKSTVKYASDVGIFCGLGGDTPNSTMGAWKRGHVYCPYAVANCPGIVANFSQRTGNSAVVITQSLPKLLAGPMLQKMANAQFPEYIAPIIFTSYTQTPVINVYKRNLVCEIYTTPPVIHDTTNGLHTFHCNVVVAPAALTATIHQAEQERLTRAQTVDPELTRNLSALFNYLVLPKVQSFQILLDIIDGPFSPANKSFTVSVVRPSPDPGIVPAPAPAPAAVQ